MNGKEMAINADALVEAIALRQAFLDCSWDVPREEQQRLLDLAFGKLAQVTADETNITDGRLRDAVLLYLDRYPDATIVDAVERVCQVYGLRLAKGVPGES